MRKTREVDEILTQAGLDPRVRKIILEQNERLRVQHQQLMGLATMFDKVVDQVTEISNKFNGLGMALDKSGLSQKITESMKNQDDGPDDTHSHSRGDRKDH